MRARRVGRLGWLYIGPNKISSDRQPQKKKQKQCAKPAKREKETPFHFVVPRGETFADSPFPPATLCVDNPGGCRRQGKPPIPPLRTKRERGVVGTFFAPPPRPVVVGLCVSYVGVASAKGAGWRLREGALTQKDRLRSTRRAPSSPPPPQTPQSLRSFTYPFGPLDWVGSDVLSTTPPSHTPTLPCVAGAFPPGLFPLFHWQPYHVLHRRDEAPEQTSRRRAGGGEDTLFS